MATYKNIRIKKKGGGTRLQRVQVLASGKYKFVKNIGNKKTKTTKRKTTRKTNKRKTTRRSSKKKKGRKSRKMTIPLGVIAPLVNTLFWANGHATMEGKVNLLMSAYTGFDPGYGKFMPERLNNGLVPLLIGALVHKFVGGAPLNVNRALGRLGVPIIRI